MSYEKRKKSHCHNYWISNWSSHSIMQLKKQIAVHYVTKCRPDLHNPITHEGIQKCHALDLIIDQLHSAHIVRQSFLKVSFKSSFITRGIRKWFGLTSFAAIWLFVETTHSSTNPPPRLYIAATSLQASGWLHGTIGQGCCNTTHRLQPVRFPCHCSSRVPTRTQCWVQVLSVKKLNITEDAYKTI